MLFKKGDFFVRLDIIFAAVSKTELPPLIFRTANTFSPQTKCVLFCRDTRMQTFALNLRSLNMSFLNLS